MKSLNLDISWRGRINNPEPLIGAKFQELWWLFGVNGYVDYWQGLFILGGGVVVFVFVFWFDFCLFRQPDCADFMLGPVFHTAEGRGGEEKKKKVSLI